MPDTRNVKWNEVDRVFSNLHTDLEHEIRVQREAIPLVFVPGIMGTCLRLSGSKGREKKKDADGLPNMRWDPSHPYKFMWYWYRGSTPAFRKRMLVGRGNFNANMLEVADADPMGDGFQGIFNEYWGFLERLKKYDWGPLRKIFEFPVYAAGYNWTDSNESSGERLVSRIGRIIDEAKSITGLCEKVILITHSMGGLVSRATSEIHHARAKILGIVHAVQPATGAPAAYWRMKAGFEKEGFLDLKGRETSKVLGPSGPHVTPVLGNLPGGLQLLPNKLHRTNPTREYPQGVPGWLTVTKDGHKQLELPKSDPYEEIYRVPAQVFPASGEKPSTNKYWGLVDPDLLDPLHPPPKPTGPTKPNDPNAIRASAPRNGDAWQQYLSMLKMAENFHDKLQKKTHPHTFCLRGVGRTTTDVVELRIESSGARKAPYPERGFRGYFTDAAGNSMKAVLLGPAGEGDGTVALSSAAALDDPHRKPPGDLAVEVEHGAAYKNTTVQDYAIQAILALVKLRYESLRGPVKD
jgi:pimeloyl-ACP methyl ester carboxylesterase